MFFGFLTMCASSYFYSYSKLTATDLISSRWLLPDFVRSTFLERDSWGSYMASHSPITLVGSTQRNAAWLKFALLKMPGKPTRMLMIRRTCNFGLLLCLLLTRHCLISLFFIECYSIYDGLVMAIKDPKTTIFMFMGCSQLLGLSYINFFPT